jgi:hypothetical protein
MRSEQKSQCPKWRGGAVCALFCWRHNTNFASEQYLLFLSQSALTNQRAEFGNRRVAQKSRIANVASVRAPAAFLELE